MRIRWLAMMLLLCGFEPLKRANPDVEEGNQAYRGKRYEQALERYERAKKTLADDARVRYDVGTALLALGRTEEAVAELGEAAKGGAGAGAFYNLGNAHLGAKRWKEAIDAYRRSLQVDPQDAKAKWNLELALRGLEEERKREEQEQQDEQDEQKQQNQQGDQEQGPEQEQEASQEPQESQPEASEPPGERKPEEPQESRSASQRPGDAAQADQTVLDAIERNEKNLQVERLRKLYRRRRVDKDW